MAGAAVPDEADEADLSEFQALGELEELRRANLELQRQLQRAKARAEDLVEATLAGAKAALVALGGVPAVPSPPPALSARSTSQEVALWHLTDFQGAKVTATYNSDVMRRRALQFCEKAAKITLIQRASRRVEQCVIAFGGDMGEGLFQFPHQVFEIDQTIFGQFVSVGRLLAEVVRRALGLYKEVIVVAEWGNHGRIGSKRSVVPPADNFDRMIYALAREILANETRLTWEDGGEDIQRLEIGNYRALVAHGDEFGRMGYASRNTIIQGANRWRSGAYHGPGGTPWEFTDVYLGHYHVHAEEPLANGLGAVYWTGSLESDNRYAMDQLASTAYPSQRLHFIDPELGRVTAQYKIYLD